MSSENEERRVAIMAELMRRSDKAEEAQYKKLTATVEHLLKESGQDAVALMGLFRALMRFAAGVAYGTVGTPSDLQFRIGDDMAGVAMHAWDDACRQAEELFAALKSQGHDVAELEKKVKLAPSDPKARADVKPIDTVPEEDERPESLEDFFGDDIDLSGKGYGGMQN